jgi:hypothetical protein
MASKKNKAPAKKTGKGKTEESGRAKAQAFTKNLVCVLTREEREQYSIDMANKLGERDHLEAEFDGVKKAWKGKLEDVDLAVSALSSKVRENRELRVVRCKRLFDYETKTVTEIRSDTGEIMEERPMSDTELQQELDFGSNDPDSEFDMDGNEDGDERDEQKDYPSKEITDDEEED